MPTVKMARIDFLISNDKHHVAMFEPVLGLLAAESDYSCRVVSLCEFRGMRTPTERFEALGLSVIQLAGRLRRSSSTGSQAGGMRGKRARQIARKLSWYLLLARAVESWVASRPNLVLLGNDGAFPYDRITARLHAYSIPFLLVQEGIRFPVPAGDDFEQYGKAGANAIAAWGQTSASFFRAQGVPPERIHLTGNPRFDSIKTTDWSRTALELKEKWKLGAKTLLFLSNPIDDQGFCTTEEKLNLIQRFVREISGLFDDPEFSLIVKLHGRESLAACTARMEKFPFRSRIILTQDAPLYPLFCLAKAAIVFASTVGLEALLLRVPLGVLEIPGWGFAFDYVSSGSALGLRWNQSMLEQVDRLLSPDSRLADASREYLTQALAKETGAAQAIQALVIQHAKLSRAVSPSGRSVNS